MLQTRGGPQCHHEQTVVATVMVTAASAPAAAMQLLQEVSGLGKQVVGR